MSENVNFGLWILDAFQWSACPIYQGHFQLFTNEQSQCRRMKQGVGMNSLDEWNTIRTSAVYCCGFFFG